MNNNIVVKIIGSLVTIFIMGFIIFFVYRYYDQEAKKSPKYSEDSSSEKENDKSSNDKKGSYTIEDYDRSKQIIIVDGKKVIIDYELTDGGSVITFNDIAVSYSPNESTIKYIVTKNLFILFIDDYDESDLVLFIDIDGNILKTYSTMSLKNYDYIINDPVVDSKTKSSFEIIDNYLYITYILYDLDYAPGDNMIQFSYKFDLDKDDFYLDEDMTNIYKK